jgi:hypothetical protein
MIPHIAERPNRRAKSRWKPPPQIAFSAPHGYAVVIESGAPVGWSPHLAPRTNPRAGSVS